MASMDLYKHLDKSGKPYRRGNGAFFHTKPQAKHAADSLRKEGWLVRILHGFGIEGKIKRRGYWLWMKKK